MYVLTDKYFDKLCFYSKILNMKNLSEVLLCKCQCTYNAKS